MSRTNQSTWSMHHARGAAQYQRVGWRKIFLASCCFLKPFRGLVGNAPRARLTLQLRWITVSYRFRLNFSPYGAASRPPRQPAPGRCVVGHSRESIARSEARLTCTLVHAQVLKMRRSPLRVNRESNYYKRNGRQPETPVLAQQGSDEEPAPVDSEGATQDLAATVQDEKSPAQVLALSNQMEEAEKVESSDDEYPYFR